MFCLSHKHAHTHTQTQRRKRDLNFLWSLFDLIAEAVTKDKPLSLSFFFFYPDQKAFMGHKWLQADPLPIHPEAMLKWPTTWIEISFQDWGHGVLKASRACSSGCSLFDVPLLLFHPNWFLCKRTDSKITSWFSFILKRGDLLNSTKFGNVEVWGFLFLSSQLLISNKFIWMFPHTVNNVKTSLLLLNRWTS